MWHPSMLTSFNVHIWKTRTRHLTWREVTHALWACALFPVQELKGHWLGALHLSALLHRRSFPCHDFSGAAPADEADKAPKDKCLLTPAGRSWHCLPKQCPVLTDCFFFFFFCMVLQITCLPTNITASTSDLLTIYKDFHGNLWP